jgi:hypothetical protein
MNSRHPSARRSAIHPVVGQEPYGRLRIWFGGAGPARQKRVCQTITITPGLAKLNFWLTLGGSGTGDFTVTLDSTIIFTANQTMIPTYADYVLVSRDVSAFADGQQHTLKFTESDPATAGGFNLFVTTSR